MGSLDPSPYPSNLVLKGRLAELNELAPWALARVSQSRHVGGGVGLRVACHSLLVLLLTMIVVVILVVIAVLIL